MTALFLGDVDAGDVVDAVGVLGFVLASLSLFLTRRDSKWTRRHAVMEDMRDSLKEIESPLVNAQDPKQALSLFSTRTGLLLNELEESIDQVPDWRFRRWLREFCDVLTSVRGGQQPVAEDGSATGLAPTQLRKVKAARADVEKMLRQLDRAVRKGGA